MVEAVKSMMNSGVKAHEVTADLISEHLTTQGVPDPELMIRTSGEHRISNFLLWQMAYTEFHFLRCYGLTLEKKNSLEQFETIRTENGDLGGYWIPITMLKQNEKG